LESKPLPVSQRIGVPPPFKAAPDDLPTPTWLERNQTF
jgi:hypothetical protein